MTAHHEKKKSDAEFSNSLESELKTIRTSFLGVNDLKKIKNLISEILTKIASWIDRKRGVDRDKYRQLQHQFDAVKQQMSLAQNEAKLMEKSPKRSFGHLFTMS